VIDKLPEFALYEPYSTRMCTPRDLLAHRSGLPAFDGSNLEALGFKRAEILRRIRYIKPHYSFREEAGYSNPAFLAAGMIASAIGGKSYEDMIRTNIFEPLKMTSSGLSHHDRKDRVNVADAHKPIGDRQSAVVPWDDHDPMAPAGAITSTIHDMANWVRMWLDEGSFEGKQVLTPQTVKEMFKPAMVETPGFAEMAPIDQDSGFSYGLGWGMYYYKGHKIIEKGGARTGMRSIVVLVPDKKLGFVVLANQNLTVVPEAVRAFLMESLLAPSGRDLQAEISAANDQVVKNFTRREAPSKPSKPPSVPRANYVGQYENDLYGVVSVLLDDDKKLWWQAGPAKVKGPLAPLGQDVFLLSYPGERISIPEEVTFVLSSDGMPTSLITESFGTLTRVK
ncbi:MAG: serine hydrolase, partial [Candidatus Obscuribacterales bacterium]|nr:serine hydrolase [Candidatus Obscuribacterales bacterium]